MKFKGSIEIIKELESLVRQHCDFIISKDASKNGVTPLGVYSKVYVIHSRPCLIVLRLEFEPRDNIGRLYLKDSHVNILRGIAPELNRKLGQIRQIYFGQRGNNGVNSS